MKKNALLITLVMLMLASVASAQKRMIVHLKDGQTVSYEMNNVDYVELEGNDSTSGDVDPAEGSVSSTVDMGTHVRWATHNVGAVSKSGVGKRFSFDDAKTAAKEWGEGWRLPTQSELQELYETCSWEWVTIDGVGGRLVTSANGNSIFLPASGIQLESQLHVVGALGVYWTDETSTASAKSAYGAYFDSANIYRMEFPKSNTFSVRLVKD